MTAIAESWVPASKLHFNSWNPNHMDEFMFSKELASIRSFGMVNPVIVREVADFYEVIDGEHRVRAAMKLGIEPIPIWNLGAVSDVQAKELTIVLNETRGSADRTKLTELLSDLLSGETTAELLEVLPFSKADLESFMGSANFDWDQMGTQEPQYRNDSRLGWVERTFRLPPDAAQIIDKAIKSVRETEDDQGTCPEWRALELICADYLGG